MLQPSALRTIPILSALAVGLYAGRVLSEWLKPGLGVALILTAGTLLLAALLLRRVPVPYRRTALPLSIYVFYPSLDPRLALAIAAIVALSLLLQWTDLRSLRTGGLQPKRAAIVVSAAIFVAFFILYLLTLAPDVLPADNGELQVVAAELGVAHPPGFALYTLLAHAFTRLPLGPTPAYRANLLSAFTSSATLAALFFSVWLLTRRLSAGLVAAVALGTATTFWAQATTANVRSLTALFSAAALLTLLLLRQQSRESARDSRSQSQAPYIAFALILSLSVTHHASLVFMGLIFVAYLLWMEPGILKQPRRWIGPLLAVLVGLLPLLYFPLRAQAGVHGAYPALATIEGFLQHVLARGFRGDLFAFTEPTMLGARLKIMANVMLLQFHPLLLLGMIAGFVLLLWQEKKLAFLLAGSFALHTLITATYRAPQTVEYMLPAYVPAALLLGYGAGASGAWRRLPALQHLFVATLLVIAMWQGVQHFASYSQLAQDRTARVYAETIVREAPEGSVVLADWHWATPLWYLQEVEGIRPDLDIRYVFPTGEPYADTWARRIAEAYASGRPVIATHYDPDSYASLPPPQPLGRAYLFQQEPIREAPLDFEAAQIELGDQVELVGYRLSAEEVAPTHEATLLLAWRATAPMREPVTLFVHLLGGDGKLYAQQDVPLRAQPDGITISRLHITPRPGATPGDYSLLIGAYHSNTQEPLAGPNGESRSPLTTVRVSGLRTPLATNNNVYMPSVTGNRVLVGFDWDNTLADRPRLYLHWRTDGGYHCEVHEPGSRHYALPAIYGPWGQVQEGKRFVNDGAYYVPLGEGIIWMGAPEITELSAAAGERVTLSPQFASSRPVMHDYVVSVRLIGYQPDNVHWAWWDLADSVPALGAIPTLKWIAGSQVRDPHMLNVAEGATPGQTIGGLLQLYDAFTQRVLPVLDEGISQAYPGIPLGRATVRAAAQ